MPPCAGIPKGVPPRAVLDALPFPLLILDAEVRVQDCNRAATEMLASGSDRPLRGLFGEILHCTQALVEHRACGQTSQCRRCLIREVVTAAVSGSETCRRVLSMEVEEGRDRKQVWLRVTASPLDADGTPLALVTLEDVSELVQLRRLIPMCASCRKVRYKDDDYWQDVEAYLLRYTAFSFTHGICPDCAQRLYPEVATAAEPADNAPGSSTTGRAGGIRRGTDRSSPGGAPARRRPPRPRAPDETGQDRGPVSGR